MDLYYLRRHGQLGYGWSGWHDLLQDVLSRRDIKRLSVCNHPDGSEKWRYLAQGGNGTPSIGYDGTIYVAGGRWLHAVSAESGTNKWTYAFLVVQSWYTSVSVDQQEAS